MCTTLAPLSAGLFRLVDKSTRAFRSGLGATGIPDRNQPGKLPLLFSNPVGRPGFVPGAWESGGLFDQLGDILPYHRNSLFEFADGRFAVLHASCVWARRKIRMRLGAGFSFAEPFPEKPPRMHWRTYLRMRAAAAMWEERPWHLGWRVRSPQISESKLGAKGRIVPVAVVADGQAALDAENPTL
jgi:hypothetical protein